MLLKEQCLRGTVMNVGGFEPNITRGYYVNFLKHETSTLDRKRYTKTFIRGMIYDFSSSSINQLFGLSDMYLNINDTAVERTMVIDISGGKLKKWTSKTSTSQLICKYVALYKISINNWIPISNATLLTMEQAEFIYKVGKGLQFNFGSVVVNNTLRAASKSKSSNALPYPSLIYHLLKDQGYKTLKGAVLEKESIALF